MAELKTLRTELRAFMHGPICDILDRWLEEANGQTTTAATTTTITPSAPVSSAAATGGAAPSTPSSDLPTACVIHAYRALLYSNTRRDELSLASTSSLSSSSLSSLSSDHSGDDGGSGGSGGSDLERHPVVRLVGGMAFVNNWHGFGLGQQRSDLVRCAGDTRDAEARLLRFLQAQGIDTSAHLTPGAPARYLTGRPLYLNVGGEVIKVPTVARPQHLQQDSVGVDPAGGGGGGGGASGGGGLSTEVLLDHGGPAVAPADVPEHLLFATMQRIRSDLVAHVKRCRPVASTRCWAPCPPGAAHSEPRGDRLGAAPRRQRAADGPLGCHGRGTDGGPADDRGAVAQRRA